MSPHNQSIPRAFLVALLTLMLPPRASPALSKATRSRIWLRFNWRATARRA